MRKKSLTHLINIAFYQHTFFLFYFTNDYNLWTLRIILSIERCHQRWSVNPNQAWHTVVPLFYNKIVFPNSDPNLAHLLGPLCPLKVSILLLSFSAPLTNSYLEIYLTSIVWTRQTFENNFGMKHKFARYLKGSYRQSSDEHFFFKYFLNIPSLRKISPKLPGSFGCYGYEWVKSWFAH